MKKRLCYTACMLGLMLTLWPGTAAAADITLEIDGQNIAGDAAPMLKSSRTYVPLRAVGEHLRAVVDYKDGTVTVAHEGQVIVLPVDGTTAEVQSADGHKQTVNLEGGAFVHNARTMVPLRFVAEAMDMQVDYLAAEQKVKVISTKPLLVDGVELKYATAYNRIGMNRELRLYANYADSATMYEILQAGMVREVAAPKTAYGSLFEISDYYMEQYVVGFYDETPAYKENSGEDATNAELNFVLYKMLEGTPEYGSDSQHLLYDVQNDKWYVFSADSYEKLVQLLAAKENRVLDAVNA